ncbi:MAG: hypothetical protein ACK4K7_10750 [Allosphingosinicella sp.]|uniref:hypothetical protein n=1 Tax=Allosphingosinicella sp. TaxID=2823234 RepID=UPI0039401934
MTAIFHQNMRTFGGGSAGRNAAFTAAFGAMAAGVGAGVVVAGFTEISNPNLTLRNRLLGFSAILGAGLTRIAVMQVGTSALGLTEYIGITWDPVQLAATHAGMVVYNNMTRTWTPYVSPAPPAGPAAPVLTIPGAPFQAVDSRGPAFIAGALAGGYGNVVVMFMHNMYNLGDRSTGFSGLQSCAENIRNALPGPYAAATIYIGGDYNVLPRDLRKRRGNMPLLTYRAQRVGDAIAGALVNTTAVNCYDYWLLSNPAPVPLANVRVFAQSRAAFASDHAAIRATI